MKIAVVGGGPVGAAAALGLARHQHDITLYETVSLPQTYELSPLDSQVAALRPAGCDWLEQLGVWQGLQDFACPYRELLFREESGTGGMRFVASEHDLEQLGFVVPVQALRFALGRELQQQEVAVVQEAFQPDSAASDYNLILAADGAKSPLCDWAEIPASTRSYGQVALTVSVRLQKLHHNIARQCFLPTGPLALLPLASGESDCALIWSLDESEFERVRGLSDQALSQEIARRCGFDLGEVEVLGEPAHFALTERLASVYYRSKVALLGDAAHSIHPLAGLGLNLSLDDARVLVEQLQGVDAAQLQEALRIWQKRRRADGRALARGVSALQRIFASKNPWLVWARNTGLHLLDGSANAQRILLRWALGA